MQAIIIRGPLGIGKSTIAKLITEELQGNYISVDRVLEEHSLDRTIEGQGISLDNFIKANEIIIEKIKTVSESTTVVIDGNFYYLEQLENLVLMLGENTHVFTLKAPVEVCISRDAARSQPYGEDAVRAVHMFVSAFDYGDVINTAEQSIDDTVRALLRLLK
jgi:tRNA uridine 5-carbamoylmethylation protein Kti12